MKEYSKKDFWIVILIALVSLFYSLPNFYPERPTVDIDTLSTQERVNNTINKAQITPRSIQPTSKGYQLLFNSTDEQLAAKDKLTKLFPTAINLVRDYPTWLKAIGAKPMSLGLDLRGGVHFLLQIDLSQLQKASTSHDIQNIQALLKSKHIRYSQINHATNNSYKINLINHKHQELALSVLRSSYPQADIDSLDDNAISITLSSNQNDKSIADYAVQKTIQALNKRVNEMGIAEASVSRVGRDQVSIDLPGIQDINRAKSLIGKTATLRLQLVQSQRDDPSNTEWLPFKEGGQLPLHQEVVLHGDAITYASASLRDGQPVVDIRLGGGQEHTFNEITSKNIGQRMAVIYVETKNDKNGHPIADAKIISAPSIQSALGSQFQITGLSSYQEANDLALLLRAGALAAPVNIIEEVTIGPSLGETNITQGVISLIIGSLLVFAFMLYYYRGMGVIANLALILNIWIIMAILSLLGATLTLPGIAGIVLTVGMAVDANVLINERIREEIKHGKSNQQAIAQGYDRAFSSIFDANMTTLITAMVLFGLGSGSVKGFAITLTIGLLASMLTAIYCTRSVLTICYQYLPNILKLAHDWFGKIKDIGFMKLSYKAMYFSIFLFISSIAALWSNGLNLGLDFTGGTQFEIHLNQTITPAEIRSGLAEKDLNPSVQAYGSTQNYMLRFAKTDGDDKELATKITQALPQAKIERKEFIGPQVGQNMVQGAILAIAASLLITMVYIALRFELRFAFSALVSLVHDPFVILGVFAATGMEFNLISLAALLTVLGYSLNDTIVVYDRVRENFKKHRHLKASDTIDLSINQTLSRTTLTSALTLLVVIALATLGGEVLRGFSIALIIGILVGTYSSIYVAGSLAVLFGLESKHLIKIRKPKPTAIV